MKLSSIKNFFKNLAQKAASAVGMVQYNVNDPHVPLLIKETIPDLPVPCPPFSVHGFTGKGGEPGTIETQAATVYATIAHGLKLVHKNSEKPLAKWSRTQNLVIMPRAGVQLNAYYDGHSLRFFYTKHGTKVVFTCESVDIVSHELGHAILDSFRPDLWSSASLEVMGFHESFGDMMSILVALWHEEIIDYVIRETGGDLRKHNAVSRIAEEMGAAAYPNLKRSEPALRNAINDFKYVNPGTLPSHAPVDKLAKESHSFSRVFTGAFYDFVCFQYETNCQKTDKKDALRIARDEAATRLLGAITIAAASPRFYDSIARAMLIVDGNMGKQCSDNLTKAFGGRGILSSTPMTSRPMAFKMDGKDSKIFQHKYGSTVRVSGAKSLRLMDHMAVAQSENQLYAINVDIPNEHYLEYDDKGRLKLELPAAKDEVLSSVKLCLDFLSEEKKVAFEPEVEPEKEFSVVDGKLKRNYICNRHHESSH